VTVLQSIIREALTPVEEDTAADWLRQYFYTHDGRAFSEQSVPWVTAPQGPAWAYDSIQFRTLWLQWAARMFKTNFGLGMLMRRMHQRPGESMFATPDETNCKSVFGRLWKMIEHCPVLRDQAPIPHRQAKHIIKLQRSVCHGAWPRGKSRLADKSIPVGHANEIDKWEHQATSTEGDPLPRFLKRGAEYPDRKFVLESTPGQKGRSRIESGRLQSTDHRYHVPCPHCGKFQVIQFGDGKSPGGIHWERKPNGDTDRNLARKTAHYICSECEGRIDDIHRPAMMNAGVWVPAGCEVDHERAMMARELPPDDRSWLRGEPSHWGSEYGSQISVFYALFHGWGDIAYDFLGKCKSPQDLRQWTNEDKAETWEVVKRKDDWQSLGERSIIKVPRLVVPADRSIVTLGIDKQESFYVYVAEAWGTGHGPHTIDYGICETAADVQKLIESKWDQEGGGQLKCSAALIDSGFRPADVHKIVNECTKRGYPVRACRGSYGQRLPGYYANKQNTSRSSNPGQWVTWVDTHSTQDWIDSQLSSGQATLFRGSLIEHQDYLEQVLNDALVASLDSHNNPREEWQRIDTMVPNDFRDCKRYAFVGRLLLGHSNPTPTHNPGRKQSRKRPNFIERPGGWLRGLKQ